MFLRIVLVPQTAMELMGVVGIIVNCALIGQSGIIHRMFPNITGTQTIILIIVLEVGKISAKILAQIFLHFIRRKEH